MTEEVMQLVEEDTDWASKNPAAVGWRIKEITGPMFARTPLKSPLNQKLISTIEVACLLYHLSMRFDAAAAFTLLAYQQLVKDRRQALTAQITEVTMAEGLGPRDGELLLTYYGTVANRGEGQHWCRRNPTRAIWARSANSRGTLHRVLSSASGATWALVT